MSLKGQVSGVQKVKDSLTSVEDAVVKDLAERVSEAISEFYGYARRVGINNPPSSPALIFARPDVAEYWALSRAKALEAAKGPVFSNLSSLHTTPLKSRPVAGFRGSAVSMRFSPPITEISIDNLRGQGIGTKDELCQ